ncbi:two-component system sensor histidine kinase NtrB [Desulfobulbus oligotrophicus]|jgi:two-component system sensor histidine kinase PilS (NtrC family)|uniref:histidine kinase n=1 Tax=Desulfobulbus oligotrophicus TaxID=1909699 RepID=A0A7T5VAM1_9BACT|nr:ATP-binding protein [Desulfobulbus oligotrophicus]MDY0391579.1 ATP-binding protein [Desulfobulbus oligotrophicus]QQG64366.1 PAS domain S-box protein [Desulfobulbus oligotrophicus]
MDCFRTTLLNKTPQADYESQRHLRWWILIRVILFTLLFALTTFFREQGHPLILPAASVTLLFLLGLYSFSILSVLLLNRRLCSIHQYGAIQLCFDVFFIALLVYATGCSDSDFSALLILPVIAAGLLLSRLGGLFIAAVTTFSYAAILILEQLRWIPVYFSATPYTPPTSFLASSNLFAIYGLLFFLAALLSGQLAGRLRITEKRLAHTAIEFDRLSILYKQIFDDISTGIITTDQYDFITSFNQAAERITGFSRSTALGKPFSQLLPNISLQEEQGRNVCDFQKQHGEAIRIGYSFSFLNMPVQKESEEKQPLRWKVITLQDISQIERMEKQVREAEKMAAIGELSASVAHDFRNPLAAISGSAQILATEKDDLSRLDAGTFKTLIGIILKESGRMAKTITDFLQFARPATIQAEWFDFNRMVDEVLMRRRTATFALMTGTVIKEVDGRLDCWGDRQQIQTVLNQLLDNACQAAGPQQGKVVLAACERVKDNQAEVQIEIRDQGPGIPDEQREKVFIPFFSSRTDGTGLGLAIVQQIIAAHGGRVEIDANAEFACVIRLLLPLPPPTP